MKTKKKNKVEKNRGSTVVEATLIMPLFIFFMLALYHILVIKMVENEIYKSGVKTAEYIAQMGYLNNTGIFVPEVYFENFADDTRIEKYVDGGVEGINFLGSSLNEEDNYFTLRINYTLKVSMPFLPELAYDKNVNIRQRYYRGNSSINVEERDGNSIYVYITDNKEAYHSTRLCTHLNLSTIIVTLKRAENMGYTACEYCGSICGNMVIITKQGSRYHSKGSCTGLKRTVYRVKLEEVGGIKKCKRCVD